jgi:hypothetical protein
MSVPSLMFGFRNQKDSHEDDLKQVLLSK